MTLQDVLSVAFVVTWLAAGVRLAAPLLLAALGEIINQRAGVVNVGLEGIMLISSLVGFIVSYHSGSPVVGTLAGTLTGMLAGVFLGWMYIDIKANQTVIGILFNLLMTGVASIAYRAVFGVSTMPPSANMFKPLPIPILSQLPILGPILFQQHILGYLALLLVPLFGVALYRTKLGLAIRAVGEHPRAADTAGISVRGTRYLCMIIGAAMAGLAGAALILGQLGIFRENVTAGRGFIALAIVIFGRWNPYVALGAALAFGAADALAMSMQMVGSPIPPQFLLMLPYLVTALAMSGVTGKVEGPEALLQPYTRE